MTRLVEFFTAVSNVSANTIFILYRKDEKLRRLSCSISCKYSKSYFRRAIINTRLNNSIRKPRVHILYVLYTMYIYRLLLLLPNANSRANFNSIPNSKIRSFDTKPQTAWRYGPSKSSFFFFLSFFFYSFYLVSRIPLFALRVRMDDRAARQFTRNSRIFVCALLTRFRRSK